MRNILSLVLILNSFICYAYENTQQLQLGSAAHPTINGIFYAIPKAYLQPNQGFIAERTREKDVNQPELKPISRQMPPAMAENSLSSDKWATDEGVERALKQAANEGKLNYVLDAAKARKLPATVAILPIVESNYNPKAISPKGAGGAWQIMPQTAADYGVEERQRFDFKHSTDLALTILNDLHEQFGNWQLAFAAYNCGAECVIRALNRNPHAQAIEDLSLPAETKNYVYRIMQINQVLTSR